MRDVTENHRFKVSVELYNLAKDRTELRGLAAERPDRLDAMVENWTQITRDVLHAPASSYAPTTKAQPVHSNREWTNFDWKTNWLQVQKQTRRWQANACRKNKNSQFSILNLIFSGETQASPSICGAIPTSGPYGLSQLANNPAQLQL